MCVWIWVASDTLLVASRNALTAHSRYAGHSARLSGRPSRKAGSSIWITRIPAASRSFTSKRSEEHTSELQAQANLVCRLLLEEKKYFDTASDLLIHNPDTLIITHISHV